MTLWRAVVWRAIVPVCGLIIFLTFGVRPLHRGDFHGEPSAIQAIKSIHTAQVQHRSQYGRFAKSLSELGPSGAGIIPEDLARGRRQDYSFTMTGDGEHYQILATPAMLGATRNRSFFSDETMVIHENDGPEAATANSKELGVK